jgi:hypothetical protein
VCNAAAQPAPAQAPTTTTTTALTAATAIGGSKGSDNTAGKSWYLSHFPYPPLSTD